MNVFFSGGSKNGKSTWAELTAMKLADGGPLYYIATMIPHDSEDDARIARHVNERADRGFTTIECGESLTDVFDQVGRNATFLVDAVTALLSNEMFHDGEFDPKAADRTLRSVQEFAQQAQNVVFVSDYIYSDGFRFDELTEEYRRGLAACDRSLAEICDCVVEVCIGMPYVYKGERPI